MQADTSQLLMAARKHRFAVGAFNIYNLEGALGVVGAAEACQSPVILQLLPAALAIGSSPLVALCTDLAKTSSVPVGVHLDHCDDTTTIDFALSCGIHSIMADGSALDYRENIQFTKKVVDKVIPVGGMVEAELGRLSGEEDGLQVAACQGSLTDPQQAEQFVATTGVGALAVCIGNVHGRYLGSPQLDFDLLDRIADRLAVPLVLHGTSGLPDGMIRRAMALGVCKFNVNTELRQAMVHTMRQRLCGHAKAELVTLINESIGAIRNVVTDKIQLFCSADKAHLIN